MAEDDPTHANEEGDGEPNIRVPSHDPLPPPPEIHYTRPNLGQRSGPTGSDSPVEFGDMSSNSSSSVRYTRGLAGGVSLSACILAGYWLGSEIDRHWIHASMPWGTIVMVLAGVFAGFYNLFRMVNRNDGN